jgi:hypothetical protein
VPKTAEGRTQPGQRSMGRPTPLSGAVAEVPHQPRQHTSRAAVGVEKRNHQAHLFPTFPRPHAEAFNGQLALRGAPARCYLPALGIRQHTFPRCLFRPHRVRGQPIPRFVSLTNSCHAYPHWASMLRMGHKQSRHSHLGVLPRVWVAKHAVPPCLLPACYLPHRALRAPPVEQLVALLPAQPKALVRFEELTQPLRRGIATVNARAHLSAPLVATW